MADEHQFDLGLVMAGAVSAGAYTAGIVDFLIQALKAWEAARGPQSPNHRVNLKVMAGTSAGGMTSSIAAAALQDPNHQPVPLGASKAARLSNRLYQSWVQKIDILGLLETTDLAGANAGLRSLLDATIIDKIAEDSLFLPQPAAAPAFVDPHLQLYLATSNLRGVPYAFEMAGTSGDAKFFMRHHADYSHFYFGKPSDFLDNIGADNIHFANYRNTLFDFFRHSTMATGAFPIGLAARKLVTNTSNYDERLWRIENECANPGGFCFDYKQIQPSWPEGMGKAYDFTAVDGGMFNNKPLELARRALTGADRGNQNPMIDATEKADRALLMIDPFPNEPSTTTYDAPDDLLSLTASLVLAFWRQARFKTEELTLAQNESIGSRFLISPTRQTADGEREPFALASGGLGAFAGFMDPAFRAHDFQLGRRNCQRFLEKHFVLRQDNPLFDGWRDNATLFERYKVAGEHGQWYLPIIPLTEELRKEEALLSWPKLSANRFKLIRKSLRGRSLGMADHFFKKQIGNRIQRKAASAIYSAFISPKLVKRVANTIESDLRTSDQIAFPPK